jgi:hypothetical protein
LGAAIATVLVIGLAGGLVVGAAAAARRTQTAFPRFLADTNSNAVLVAPSTANGLQKGGYDRVVAQLPSVADAGLIAGLVVTGPVSPNGPLQMDPSFSANASVDGRALYRLDRPKMIAGRLPNPNSPTEVFLNPTLARMLHAGVGSRIPIATATSVPKGFPNVPPGPSNFKRLTVTVSGIGVGESQILPANVLDAQPEMDFTPAFYRTYSTAPGVLGYDGVEVRLKPGVDHAAFRRQVEDLARKMGVGPAFVVDSATHADQVRRTLLPQVTALWLFAALAGAGLILVAGLVLSRRVLIGAAEYPVLRSLGMTRGQLITASLAEASILAVVGAILAVLVAILTSAFTPLGAARLAELHPGVSVDAAILGAGFLALVALIVGVAAIPAVRAASLRGDAAGQVEYTGADRPSAVAERITRGGLPATAGVGVRMALEPGRGRTAVPVRSGTIGLAVALAAITAVFTFGSNLTGLIHTPRQFGWNWDAMVGSPFGFSSVPVGFLEKVQGVDRVTGGNLGTVTIDGQSIPAVGLDPHRGIAPTMIAGRPPESDGEIALGSKDLRRLGASIGSTVTVQVAGTQRRMRVVGEPVFPALGQGSFEPTGLGEGALVTATTLAAVANQSTGGRYQFAAIDFKPGADPNVVRAAIRRAAVTEPGCHPPNSDPPCLFIAPTRPADINSYAAIQSTPFALAGVLTLLALALMAFMLITSVRRRRRDLAVLKTLGFRRGQVSASVAWQASLLALIAGVIGLPIGVIAGRWAWTVFAQQLGVPPSPVVPVALLLLAVPAGLLAANLIAWIPGRLAARTPAAVVLRSE